MYQQAMHESMGERGKWWKGYIHIVSDHLKFKRAHTARKGGKYPGMDANMTNRKGLSRIEWIRFYVREGELQKAYDLGWDGKPFRMTPGSSRPRSDSPPG